MDDPDTDTDPQDHAEVFDETHIDDEGVGDTDFDDMEPVLDVTRNHGDPIKPSYDETSEVQDEARHRAGIEAQADALLGVNHTDDEDTTGEVAPAEDEIDLVYTGLMRNQRGAQASAAHWEAKRLSDDDITELGYGPESEDPR